jgi:hypothetical protein
LLLEKDRATCVDFDRGVGAASDGEASAVEGDGVAVGIERKVSGARRQRDALERDVLLDVDSPVVDGCSRAVTNVAVPLVGTTLFPPCPSDQLLLLLKLLSTVVVNHVASTARATVAGSAADAKAEVASSMIRRRDARRGAARLLSV